MSGPDSADSKGVTFEGDFTPEERALLSTQFSRCHFQLSHRAQRDPSRAVVAWTAGPDFAPRRGPAPLRTVPAAAVYVIAGTDLIRARTREDVERALGEPLGDRPLAGLSQPNPVWESARQALRGLIPWR
jgi:hypothetical protein